MFDRESEWDDLARFAADERPGATLGIVTGRRRQGKTLLLYELARQTGGFYFGATEATDADSLRRLGEDLGQHVGAPGPIQLGSWGATIDALLGLGRDQSAVIVIDELPYLVRANPELPSVIQQALTPGRPQRTGSRARILLCGSALSFMGGLLSGSAPLRGRAGLELLVPPLDYRAAAEFWGLSDPASAIRVHAIVGGTPAYRREYVQDDAPSGPDDVDDWVVRAVLNPTRPLFREARYLLAEDPALREPALYHSVLAAVAEGNRTRGGIAAYIGRAATDVQHPLTVLEDAGLLVRQPDLLRHGRSNYVITEPLIRFYHAVMRPSWTMLEQRQGRRVWRRSAQRFTSAVLGPHFEELLRQFVLRHASPTTMGGEPSDVGHGSLVDPQRRTGYELDLVVFGDAAPGDRIRPLLAIGEAKWSERMGFGHVARLERARELLRSRSGIDGSDTRLVLASAGGFTADLRAAAADRPDLVLVDADRLYYGE